MVEPACGPCHFCQVSGRTVHVLSSVSSPFLISSKATSVVIILAIDAGGMRASAFLAKQHRARRQVDQIGDLAPAYRTAAPWPARRWRGVTRAAVASRMARIMDRGGSWLRWLTASLSPDSRAARGASAAGDRVGEQADRQRVEIRAIIIEDRAVIVGQQISGRARAVGLEQGRQLILGKPRRPASARRRARAIRARSAIGCGAGRRAGSAARVAVERSRRG